MREPLKGLRRFPLEMTVPNHPEAPDPGMDAASDQDLGGPFYIF
jgi:hypothetical protein